MKESGAARLRAESALSEALRLGAGIARGSAQDAMDVLDWFDASPDAKSDLASWLAASPATGEGLRRCPFDDSPALTLSGNCGHSWSAARLAATTPEE